MITLLYRIRITIYLTISTRKGIRRPVVKITRNVEMCDICACKISVQTESIYISEWMSTYLDVCFSDFLIFTC